MSLINYNMKILLIVLIAVCMADQMALQRHVFKNVLLLIPKNKITEKFLEEPQVYTENVNLAELTDVLQSGVVDPIEVMEANDVEGKLRSGISMEERIAMIDSEMRQGESELVE